MVDVLNDDYCETELTQNGTLNFVHKPEVLCVGYNHSYNIRVYIKNSQGKLYKHVPRNNERYKNLVSVGSELSLPDIDRSRWLLRTPPFRFACR